MLWRKKPFATCSFEKNISIHFPLPLSLRCTVRAVCPGGSACRCLGCHCTTDCAAAAQATKHKDILHAAQLLSSQTLHGRKRHRGGQGQRRANDSANFFSQNLELPISMGSTEMKQSLVNVATCWNRWIKHVKWK